MENMKRVVSLMLCIVMVFGLLPMTVFATGTDVFFEEEEIIVEADVVGNENPVNPEDIIFEEEVIEETAPVVDNEDPIAPVAEGDYEPETVEVDKTETTYDKQNVYKYVEKIDGAGDYLIVDTKAATTGANALTRTNNGITNKANVTVTTGATKDGQITYIATAPADAAVWAATASGTGYTLKSGTRNLRYSNNNLTTSSNNSTTWTSGTNLLYVNSNGDKYVRYNNGWGVATSTAYVYLYKLQEVEFAHTTTLQGTYSIEAEGLSAAATAGRTVELKNVNLIFTPKSGTATTEDVTKTAVYTVVEGGDIVSVANGVATFTGKTGEAVVKVSYENEHGTVVNYFTVTAAAPDYSLSIFSGDQNITDTTVSVKKVTAATTMQLTAKAVLTGEDAAETVTPVWEIPAEYKNIATIDATGKISFKGVDGEFYVTATWVDGNGKSHTARVDISATTTSYIVPSDNTTDFPEYPNEGAIRYDKTATAVGNFAETGIAKMELSMTGVPYSTGSEIDVVIMLDRSSSMYKTGVQHRISSTVAATKTFIESIVKNADGSFNGNRIMVMDFLGGNLDSSQGGGSSHKYQSNLYTSKESNGYQVIDNQAEMEALFTTIETGFKGQTSLYGTEYAQGLEDCYNALKDSRADGNQQFCVFMSDGIPNYLMGEKTHFKKTSDIVGMFTVTNSNSSSASVTRNSTKYEYEYYSTQMKNEGVTVYTVGLGLQNTNSAWSSASKEACEQVANMLLNDIAGPAGEKAENRDTGKTVSKKDTYFFSVSDDGSQSGEMKNVFAGIAQKIMQAATDVTVEDQIGNAYTMIFDVPTGSATSDENPLPVGDQKFYIEFLKYALDTNNERTGTPTSLSKMYLKNSGNQYSAVNENGTAYASPVFEQKTLGDKGTLYYWTTDASKGDTGVSYKVGNTTYYFVSYGLESGYNMTSGGFASGTVNATNTSTDLILATPYFVYNASTKMLYWTVDKLDTAEYVLNYFLYLNNSATEVVTGTDTKEIPAGSYQTNDHAYITYTNFNGNECRQEFPKPQMTWNGAQASYVFYLVNAQGQPINKSGQVVDFANAIFVTDVFTTSIVWNKGADGNSDGNAKLDVDWLASEKLPAGYSIYDEKAQYALQVHETETGAQTGTNQFTIAGGTAAEISASLNSRLELGTTANTVSIETTKVYNTKAGTKYDDYGTYTSKNTPNFDFANTTVAFAVVWEAKLNPDTVVVDFGLDVLIDVVQNDFLQNTVNGIGFEKGKYSNTKENDGFVTHAEETWLGNNDKNANGDTIKIENENQIRFHQGDMKFETPVTFYYDSVVKFHQDGSIMNGYLYSSVTVIPATTIYYEDDFVTLNSYTWDYDNNGWKETANAWTQEGTTINATQAQDRPGAANISGNIDADNIYGYDSAYETCSTYSMGSAKKVYVDYDNYSTATFDFYGTGFDIISLTSDRTGMAIAKIYPYIDGKVYEEPVKSIAVDTYYGYNHVFFEEIHTYNDDGKWVTEQTPIDEAVFKQGVNDPVPENPVKGETTYTTYTDGWEVVTNKNKGQNALYQIPVLKAEGLPYGRYHVVLSVQYGQYFDHDQYPEEKDEENGDIMGGYDFYLDAIRIYDPCNTDIAVGKDKDGKDKTVGGIYKEDGEFAPSYQEIRNNLIKAESFDISNSEKINGFMYIDGDDVVGIDQLEDYKNYGPNNEVYLKKGQSIAFKIDAPDKSNLQLKNVHFGAKSADGKDVTYSVANIFNNEFENKQTFTLETATDMYYDLTAWTGAAQVIVITNESDSILSLTNLKYTYGEKDSSIFAMTPKTVEESVEAYAYMTVADAEMVLRVLNTPVVEETEPTEPETEATEPETEATQPEVTEPETESGSNSGSNTGSVVKTIIGIIGKLLGKIFG